MLFKVGGGKWVALERVHFLGNSFSKVVSIEDVAATVVRADSALATANDVYWNQLLV